MSLMRNMTVYMVGKGPSLDRISKEDFPDSAAPVMCMNDSILKVDTLGLDNPMYVVQNGYFKEHECVPNKGLVFVTERAQHTVEKVAIRAIFNPDGLGYGRQIPGMVFAIKIALYFGANRFVFLCFDSCTSGSEEYADCIGEMCKKIKKEAELSGIKSPLWTHKGRIAEAVGDTPYEFREVAAK